MLRNLIKDESGASAVEYGLLVALIAVVIVGGLTVLGQNINTKLTSAGSSVGK